MKLNSKKEEIQANAEKIFKVLTNCNNLQKNIPGIENWTSTEDKCSFSVAGAGHLEIEIVSKNPFDKVVYRITSAHAKHIEVVFLINSIADNLSTLEINGEVDLPFFMAQMVKSSMQKMIDELLGQIKFAIENSTIA